MDLNLIRTNLGAITCGELQTEGRKGGRGASSQTFLARWRSRELGEFLKKLILSPLADDYELGLMYLLCYSSLIDWFTFFCLASRSGSPKYSKLYRIS